MIILIYLLCFYFSVPGLINKAGYPIWKGLIPFYNLYLLVTILEISPFVLMLLGLGLIFLPDRMWVATLIAVFLPFLIADAYAYDKSIRIGVLTFLCPFILYPYLAYSSATYGYNLLEER